MRNQWDKASKMNYHYLQGMAGFLKLKLSVDDPSDKTHNT